MSDTATMSTVYAPGPRLAPTIGQPCPAIQTTAIGSSPAASDRKAVGKMLTSLIHDESALYAITREWRYDAVGRKFVRLHLLLDEQFSEIGVRLTRLAARSRDLGAWNGTGHGDIASVPRAAMAAGALQTYIIRELLRYHETLVARLKRTRSVTGGRFADTETAELMAALAADHEKDAFMLRELLWEVENNTG